MRFTDEDYLDLDLDDDDVGCGLEGPKNATGSYD